MIHARNFACDIGDARLTALVDPVAEALKQGMKELGIETGFRDYHAALESKDVQGVVITTPTAYHRDIAVAAAKAGKHILCEKPMAMNADECEEMIAAAKKHGVKLQIGFMRRFDRSFQHAKNRIQAGEIGRVVQVKSLTHGPSIPKPWMYDLKKSNGPLAEVNSHDIDILRWFADSEFKTVYAIGGNYRCPDAKKEFPDFYDNVSLVASFANETQGFIGGAQGVRYGYDARTEILGTEGIICVGHIDDTSVVSCTQAGVSRPIVKSWMDLFLDAYRAEDEDFIRCIIEDRPPKASGLDGKRAVEVVNAGNKSIRTGKIVKLEY
jgi:myo-inositol 2-dehydrogenase/D-chiro-inositol 1-dehydrogenase/scyllo-inositol 2-dehydrogenase (NAD+)